MRSRKINGCLFVLVTCCLVALLFCPSLYDHYRAYRLSRLRGQLVSFYNAQEEFYRVNSCYAESLEALSFSPEEGSIVVLWAYPDGFGTITKYVAFTTWPGYEWALFIDHKSRGLISEGYTPGDF